MAQLAVARIPLLVVFTISSQVFRALDAAKHLTISFRKPQSFVSNLDLQFSVSALPGRARGWIGQPNLKLVCDLVALLDPANH
jgi:hypothetical protein